MNESLRLYLVALKDFSREKWEKKNSYFELMGISWALHVLYGIYSVFALYLGVKSYEYFSSPKTMDDLPAELFNFKMQKISLMTTLFLVVLYPCIFHVSYKFWKGSFKFYAHLFENRRDDLINLGDEILCSAFSSNLFLILPIVGKVLSHLAFIFILFQGLRVKYKFSSLQALLVVMTPLSLLFLFIMLTASYFFFLIALL